MPVPVIQPAHQQHPEIENCLRYLDQAGLTAAAGRAAGLIEQESRSQWLPVFYLGRQPYRPVWTLQRQLHARRVAGELPDIALLLEHEPVYTLGKHADERHLLADRPADAELVPIDRGGDVTYHGPGQLVGYPIVNLRDHRCGVARYLWTLEEVIIRALATYNLAADRMPGLPGVWVRQRKVAALGVRLARWTTMHGFALNVCVPRRYLAGMIPCGLRGHKVANLNDFLPEPTDVPEVARRLAPLLRSFLGSDHFSTTGQAIPAGSAHHGRAVAGMRREIGKAAGTVKGKYRGALRELTRDEFLGINSNKGIIELIYQE